MKKAVFLAMVMIGFFAAQNAAADQRIVGTWVGTLADGTIETYVFNANGTGTLTNSKGETANIFWGVSFIGEICISRNDTFSGSYSKYAISPDGRKMFIDKFNYQKK
jgi:hypothetical protein